MNLSTMKFHIKKNHFIERFHGKNTFKKMEILFSILVIFFFFWKLRGRRGEKFLKQGGNEGRQWRGGK